MGLLSRLSLKAIENLQVYGVPNLVRHLGGWSPFPVAVVLVVTQRCNLNCEMCLLSTEQRADAHGLSLTELKAVVDDLHDSFPIKPFVHLTGGEPLLRSDLHELIAYIRAKGMACSLTTNGLLLPRQAKQLVNLGLRRINVSLDGPAAIHDSIRGVAGAHAQALAGIKAVVAARKALGARQPTVTVNTVMSQTNLDHLAEMVPLIASAGADALTFQHLMFTDCTNAHLAPQDMDHFIQVVSGLEAEGKRVGIPVTLYPRMSTAAMRTYYLGEASEIPGRCIAPWYVVRVDQDGDITFCHEVIADNVRTKTRTFGQAWNSKPYRAFRRDLSRCGVFADCGRCCHRQYPRG